MEAIFFVAEGAGVLREKAITRPSKGDHTACVVLCCVILCVDKVMEAIFFVSEGAGVLRWKAIKRPR